MAAENKNRDCIEIENQNVPMDAEMEEYPVIDVELQEQCDIDVTLGGTVLQDKQVGIIHNGTHIIAPDYGFDGMRSVVANVNVEPDGWKMVCTDGSVGYYSLPYIFTENPTFMHNTELLSFDCRGYHYNTDKVSSLYRMFYGCTKIEYINLSGFDTSNVTNMSNMFYGCSSLQSLDVSGFDTSNVTNMSNMFQGCSSLQSLDVSGFDTSKVTGMGAMFSGCSSLQSVDVSGFDTKNVTIIGGMFRDCKSLVYANVSGFYVSKTSQIANFFWNCQKLEIADITGWSELTIEYNAADFAARCDSLRSVIGNKTLEDVENGLVVLPGLHSSTRSFGGAYLRFSSMLAVLNGVADLTGTNAQTIVFNRTAFGHMYNDDDTTPNAETIAERQARLRDIAARKNWNIGN